MHSANSIDDGSSSSEAPSPSTTQNPYTSASITRVLPTYTLTPHNTKGIYYRTDDHCPTVVCKCHCILYGVTVYYMVSLYITWYHYYNCVTVSECYVHMHG